MVVKSFELGSHVVGFVATSQVDQKMVEEVHKQINSALKKHNKLALYCENASGEPETFKAMIKDISYKIKHKDSFCKIAVVGETSLTEVRTKLQCTFMNADCRYFPIKKRTDALSWISGG